jgi:flagellar biosynthetic protein FliR
MESVLKNIGENFEYLLLLFIRITGLLVTSPIFGRKNIPNTFKIGFCLILTYAVFAGIGGGTVQVDGVLQYAVLVVKELLFGVALGYVTTLFFTLVQTAGYIIDMQIGFGMVNVLDVQLNISIPLIGNLLYIVLLISFLCVNGHHKLIYILTQTAKSIPIGQVALSPQLGITALEVFMLAFMLAVNVAIPLIAAGLLGEVAMGIVVRTTPQINMFVVGIPLKILIGYAMLLITIPVFVAFTNTIFDKMFISVSQMLRGLMPG